MPPEDDVEKEMAQFKLEQRLASLRAELEQEIESRIDGSQQVFAAGLIDSSRRIARTVFILQTVILGTFIIPFVVDILPVLTEIPFGQLWDSILQSEAPRNNYGYGSSSSSELTLKGLMLIIRGLAVPLVTLLQYIFWGAYGFGWGRPNLERDTYS